MFLIFGGYTVDSLFTKSLLAIALAAALTACGGSSGSASAPNEDNSNDPTEQPAPGTPSNPSDPNEDQTPEPEPQPEPQPEPDPEAPDEEPVDEPEPVDPQVLTLLDTNNNVTVSFCPQLVADVPFGGAIDSLACENEALTNLSIDNNSSLGLICPQTVAQVPGSFADTLPDPEFLPACLMEGAESIQANLTGLFDGTSPLLAETCRDSDDFAGCFIDTMTSLPETFAGFAAVLGCEDFEDPQVCLVGAGEKFASGELLIGGANILTQAVCPLANNQAEFDPQACGQEIFSGLGNVLGTSGGIEELCGPDADPFTCFLEAGDRFEFLTDLFEDSPLSPELVTSLIEGLSDPENAELLDMFPSDLDSFPLLGDLISGGLEGGAPDFDFDPFAFFEPFRPFLDPDSYSAYFQLFERVADSLLGEGGNFPPEDFDFADLPEQFEQVFEQVLEALSSGGDGFPPESGEFGLETLLELLSTLGDALPLDDFLPEFGDFTPDDFIAFLGQLSEEFPTDAFPPEFDGFDPEDFLGFIGQLADFFDGNGFPPEFDDFEPGDFLGFIQQLTDAFPSEGFPSEFGDLSTEDFLGLLGQLAEAFPSDGLPTDFGNFGPETLTELLGQITDSLTLGQLL